MASSKGGRSSSNGAGAAVTGAGTAGPPGDRPPPGGTVGHPAHPSHALPDRSPMSVRALKDRSALRTAEPAVIGARWFCPFAIAGPRVAASRQDARDGEVADELTVDDDRDRIGGRIGLTPPIAATDGVGIDLDEGSIEIDDPVDGNPSPGVAAVFPAAVPRRSYPRPRRSARYRCGSGIAVCIGRWISAPRRRRGWAASSRSRP